MSMIELEQALEVIKNSDRSRFVGPRSTRLVDDAENALGIRFPPTYRRFLSELGCGNVGRFEVYGLIDDSFQDSMIPNGIWLTLRERRESGLPDPLIIVGATGDGALYVLDTSRRNHDNESPVAIWWPNSNEPLEDVSTDFGEFLLTEIQRVTKS